MVAEEPKLAISAVSELVCVRTGRQLI
jgi:hypothetical protein